VRGIGRRHDKRGLGDVHLLGDALHHLARYVLCVENDRQLVAGKRLLSEDVYQVDPVAHAG
jgi:hypothetical protein